MSSEAELSIKLNAPPPLSLKAPSVAMLLPD